MTYQIFIPTWKRVGKTETLKHIPPSKSILVLRPEEESYYYDPVFPAMILPSIINTIGKTRDYIIRNATADYVWMVDDDVSNDNIIEGIEYITYYAEQEDAGIFGFGKHFMINQRLEKDGIFSRCGSSDRIWGVHREKYLSSNLNMSRYPVLEDLYCWMGMQIAGHRALISNEYESKTKEPKTGGCSTYRTAELVRNNLYKLQNDFPRHFAIKESERETVQNINIGLNFRTSWAKIHKEIPRI